MIEALREKCAQEGFDLVDPIHTRWYNDLIEKEGHVAKGTLQKMPESLTIIADGGETVDQYYYNAVLIGNSKSIWPKFISWLSLQYRERLEQEHSSCNSDEDILNQLLSDNPFDTFVTSTLSKVFQSCCSDRSGLALESYEFFWSNGTHHKVNCCSTKNQPGNEQKLSAQKSSTTGDYHCFVDNDLNEDEEESFLVSMQRIAKITGKYWHDEDGTKLCVHPRFGTWKAFRAVVVFHTVKTEHADDTIITAIPESPPMCACPVDAQEIQRAKEVLERALELSFGKDGYGGREESTPTAAHTGKEDLCQYLHNTVSSGSDWSKVSPMMRPWIELRDCITVGRDEHKYSDHQILYHYTKDTDILKKELQDLL